MASGKVNPDRPEWLDGFPTRHYLSRDPIQNLSVYVKLIAVKKDGKAQEGEENVVEDAVFNWQEKVLSRSEEQTLRDFHKSSSSSALGDGGESEERYRQHLESKYPRGYRRGTHLSTKVDQDNHGDIDDHRWTGVYFQQEAVPNAGHAVRGYTYLTKNLASAKMSSAVATSTLRPNLVASSGGGGEATDRFATMHIMATIEVKASDDTPGPGAGGAGGCCCCFGRRKKSKDTVKAAVDAAAAAERERNNKLPTALRGHPLDVALLTIFIVCGVLGTIVFVRNQAQVSVIQSNDFSLGFMSMCVSFVSLLLVLRRSTLRMSRYADDELRRRRSPGDPPVDVVQPDEAGYASYTMTWIVTSLWGFLAAAAMAFFGTFAIIDYGIHFGTEVGSSYVAFGVAILLGFVIKVVSMTCEPGADDKGGDGVEDAIGNQAGDTSVRVGVIAMTAFFLLAFAGLFGIGLYSWLFPGRVLGISGVAASIFLTLLGVVFLAASGCTTLRMLADMRLADQDDLDERAVMQQGTDGSGMYRTVCLAVIRANTNMSFEMRPPFSEHLLPVVVDHDDYNPRNIQGGLDSPQYLPNIDDSGTFDQGRAYSVFVGGYEYRYVICNAADHGPSKKSRGDIVREAEAGRDLHAQLEREHAQAVALNKQKRLTLPVAPHTPFPVLSGTSAGLDASLMAGGRAGSSAGNGPGRGDPGSVDLRYFPDASFTYRSWTDAESRREFGCKLGGSVCHVGKYTLEEARGVARSLPDCNLGFTFQWASADPGADTPVRMLFKKTNVKVTSLQLEPPAPDLLRHAATVEARRKRALKEARYNWTVSHFQDPRMEDASYEQEPIIGTGAEGQYLDPETGTELLDQTPQYKEAYQVMLENPPVGFDAHGYEVAGQNSSGGSDSTYIFNEAKWEHEQWSAAVAVDPELQLPYTTWHTYEKRLLSYVTKGGLLSNEAWDVEEDRAYKFHTLEAQLANDRVVGANGVARAGEQQGADATSAAPPTRPFEELFLNHPGSVFGSTAKALQDVAVLDPVCVTVLGSIVSAQGFDCADDLYIRFQWEMPTGWVDKVQDTKQMGGASHVGAFTHVGVADQRDGNTHRSKAVWRRGSSHTFAGPSSGEAGSQSRSMSSTASGGGQGLHRSRFSARRHPLTGSTKRRCRGPTQGSESFVADALYGDSMGVRHHHFSYPFTLDMLTWNTTENPRLVMEVVAVDSLNTHRTIGYSHVSLPSSAGRTSVSTDAWKPDGGAEQAMHGLFLGEEAALNRLSFVTVPSDHSGPFLNKQGLTATVAGGICVEFNIVKQHRKGSLVDSALKAAVSHAFVRPPLATGGGRTIAGLDSRSPGVASVRSTGSRREGGRERPRREGGRTPRGERDGELRRRKRAEAAAEGQTMAVPL